MLKFLRYNSRHHFYWCLGGGRDKRKLGWPKINPISSSYGAGLRVISWHEPRWLYQWRQRVFAFAGRQRCGRRGESWHGASNAEAAPDTWDLGPDGNRTCSYCGSIHPDDLMKICRLTLKDERYGVEGTDKAYKVYVKQPGVRNAGEGAIKFYMAHAPAQPSAEDQELFTKASRVTRERFNAMMNERYPSRAKSAA